AHSSARLAREQMRAGISTRRSFIIARYRKAILTCGTPSTVCSRLNRPARSCTCWRMNASSRAWGRLTSCGAPAGWDRSGSWDRHRKPEPHTMTLLLGATTIGLILALLALGVYLSFRIFNFPDITADSSITLGASVTATLLVHHWSPWLATLAGFAAGVLAGAITGVLHTKFKINGLLSGILVMTALYSVNLHVMGKSNVPLLNEATLASQAESLGLRLLHTTDGDLNIFGWSVGV